MITLSASHVGTPHDHGFATNKGFVAHFHANDNTRDGDTTVRVQHSEDQVTWVDLFTFTSVPAGEAAMERATGEGAVHRYLRATSTLGGTTGSVTITTALARR